MGVDARLIGSNVGVVGAPAGPGYPPECWPAVLVPSSSSVSRSALSCSSVSLNYFNPLACQVSNLYLRSYILYCHFLSVGLAIAYDSTYELLPVDGRV